MTGQLRNVLGALARPRDERQSSSAAFAPLDVDAVAASLELDTRAHAAGRANLPPSHASTSDSTEQALATAMQDYAGEARALYQQELDLYAARASRHALSSAHQVQIEAAGENALADFVALTRDDLDQLFLQRDRVRACETEFSRFRSAHALQRAPRIVSPREHLFRWLVLVTIVLSEAIANGLFFATASSGGVIGGVTQALGFAVLNVGVMLLAARVLRGWAAHRSWWLKVLGTVGLLLAVLWCLGLNLTLAHFRDLYVSGEASVSVDQLLAQLRTQPGRVADFQSWLLAALGVGFALVAFIDALGLGDPYPGYERVARARSDAIVDYTEAKADCLAGLMQRRDEALQAMQDAITVLHRSQHEYQLALQGRSRLQADYQAYLAQLASVHAQLVARYRELNQRTRSTPAPDWFADAPRTPSVDDVPAMAVPDTDAGVIEAVVGRMREYIKSVNGRYEDALEQHASLQLLTADLSANPSTNS